MSNKIGTIKQITQLKFMRHHKSSKHVIYKHIRHSTKILAWSGVSPSSVGTRRRVNLYVLTKRHLFMNNTATGISIYNVFDTNHLETTIR